MNNNTQKRYTDQELISLLQNLATDLGKRPTQREILYDDRMPTHHTYINRFGSIENAMIKAGINKLSDRSHAKEVFVEVLQEEFPNSIIIPQTEEAILTYKLKNDDDEMYIDFINLTWDDDNDHTETLEKVKEMRFSLFETTDKDINKYKPVESIKEIYLLNQIA